VLAGCSAKPSAPNTAQPTSPTGSSALTAVVTSADLAVGPNHFGLALLDGRTQPIAEAAVLLTFYDLAGPQPTLVGQADGVWRRPGTEWNRGLYKADVTFERPGSYGVEAAVTRESGEVQVARARFEVAAQSQAPAIGAPAPRSHNLTVHDRVEPIELCTATAETCAATDRLRQVTIADAIAQGKPLVVLFATPGFCTSQTCGPQLEVLQTIAIRSADRANFIHVEIFKDPATRTVNGTVQEWNLPSEPWVFVIDSAGRIADRFDGITTAEEIEQALQRLLA
jgi:hypothetical protein